MSEHEEFESKFLLFELRMAGGYMQMSKVLLALELPISLRPFDADMSPRELVDEVNVARRALHDLPMNEGLRAAVSTAVLDWLIGMQLARFAANEQVLWAIEAANLAAARACEEIELARAILDGEVTDH